MSAPVEVEPPAGVPSRNHRKSSESVGRAGKPLQSPLPQRINFGAIFLAT